MNKFHRLVQLVSSSQPGAWFFARAAHHLDRPVLRLTGNRAALSSLLAGIPVFTLTTTGAKTGRPRSVPLLGVREGDTVALFASNFGQARYPAWYYNLRQHPEATLSFDGQTRLYVAREAEGEERAAYWRRAVEIYPGYALYEQRIGDKRHVPVMVLEPL